jgi:predicted nucleic acid-binding protein
MIFVDTGYLLALIQPRDSLHERALRWAHWLKEELITTEYVLLETFNALSAPVDRPKAHSLLARLRSGAAIQIFSSSQPLFEAGLELHRVRPDKAWSLTDCISFQIMGEQGISRALAHDDHFQQAGFEALLRREPEN